MCQLYSVQNAFEIHLILILADSARTTGAHPLNGDGEGCTIGRQPSVFFGGSRPGRGAKIPRAVLTSEGGLWVGYGGCGRPGPGLGCAESLSGVPRLYDHPR